MHISRSDFNMFVERIVYPVLVLGVGKRIGIWLQGCPHYCTGCINPELWEQKEENNIDITKIVNSIASICLKNEVDGFTITGGEPLLQIEQLYLLLLELKKFEKEILVYTGYTIKEIQDMDRGKQLLELIDVLIDGKYEEEQNILGLALRGSQNQNIYYRNSLIEDRYKEYLQQGRKLQHFYNNKYMLSIGIHDRSEVHE